MRQLYSLTVRLLLLGSLLLAAMQSAQAAYPQAGQLTYRYLGSAAFPNRYLVQVQYVWDCGGIQPATSLSFSCRAGGCAGTLVAGTLTEIGTPVLGQPYCPALQSTVVCGPTGNALPETYLTHTLEGMVDLPPAAEWVISCELAGRPAMGNIGLSILRLEATLNSLITPIGGGATQAIINNSPAFNTSTLKPFAYVNAYAEISFSASDAADSLLNGRADSLVYSLERPLNGCGSYASYLVNPAPNACTPVTLPAPSPQPCLLQCGSPTGGLLSATLPLPVSVDTVGSCPGIVTTQPRFNLDNSGTIYCFPNYYEPTGANGNAGNHYALVGQVTEYRKINGHYYKVGSMRRDLMLVLAQPTAGSLPPSPPTVRLVTVPYNGSGTPDPISTGDMVINVRTCSYTRVVLRFTSPNNTPASPSNTLLNVSTAADLNTTLLQNGAIGTFAMSGNGTATPFGVFQFQPQQRTANTIIYTTLRIEDTSCPVRLVGYGLLKIQVVAGQTARIIPAQGSAAGVCTGGALVLQGYVNRPDSVRTLSTGAVGLQTYNYHWSIMGTGNGLPAIATTQNITVNPTVPTRYRLTITPASGFDAATCIDTVSILVRVQAPPATPTVTRVGNVLTSSSPTGNQWYLNGQLIAGATGQTYVATASGTYTVVVSATTGGITCASQPSNRLLGTQHALPGTSLSVAPNPTLDGRFNVTLTGYRQAVALTLFDALGRPVRQAAIAAPNPAGTTQLLDIAPLPSGLYILQVRTAGGIDTRRIVRE